MRTTRADGAPLCSKAGPEKENTVLKKLSLACLKQDAKDANHAQRGQDQSNFLLRTTVARSSGSLIAAVFTTGRAVPTVRQCAKPAKPPALGTPKVARNFRGRLELSVALLIALERLCHLRFETREL